MDNRWPPILPARRFLAALDSVESLCFTITVVQFLFITLTSLFH